MHLSSLLRSYILLIYQFPSLAKKAQVSKPFSDFTKTVLDAIWELPVQSIGLMPTLQGMLHARTLRHCLFSPLPPWRHVCRTSGGRKYRDTSAEEDLWRAATAYWRARNTLFYLNRKGNIQTGDNLIYSKGRKHIFFSGERGTLFSPIEINQSI